MTTFQIIMIIWGIVAVIFITSYLIYRHIDKKKKDPYKEFRNNLKANDYCNYYDGMHNYYLCKIKETYMKDGRKLLVVYMYAYGTRLVWADQVFPLDIQK